MRPPRLARALLRILAPRTHRDAIVDDLDDAFERERRERRARWYWRQVLAGVPSLLRLHLRGRTGHIGGAMRRFALDVRYGARALRRTPGFTIVAVASLAIGIGASTALYGAMRVALIDVMPVDRANELRLLYWSAPEPLRISQYNSGGYLDPQTQRGYRSNVSLPGLEALISLAPDRLFGFNFVPGLTVDADGAAASSASGLLVTGGAFSVLGVPLIAGRGIEPADDTPAATPVAVLTHRLWTTAFGGDPDVVGRVIRINGHAHEIVGVTAASFTGLSTGGRLTPHADVIVPVSDYARVWPAIERERTEGIGPDRLMWLRAMVRVPDGESDAVHAAGLTAILGGLLQESGVVTRDQAADVVLMLRPGARGVDGMTAVAERPLRILSAVVGIVLLIACVNIAALMLARGVSRQRELAVRQALGSGRAGLIRQLLAECLVLAALGGLAGVALALAARPVVASMLRTGFDADVVNLPVDWRTFGTAAGVSFTAVILFGLLPAVRTTSGGLIDRLRQHMIGAAVPRQRLGRALLALQIAVSVPLLVAAILMLRTLHNLDRANTGFRPDGIVMFRLDASYAMTRAGLTAGTDDRGTMAVFLRRLLERLEAVPGITSATVVENLLLSGFTSDNQATIDGQRASMHVNGIGPRFFETFGLPLIAGRAPTLEEGLRPTSLVVINQTAARRFFGDASPLGRRFLFGTRDVEVIGVAADSKYDGVRSEVPPTLFDPYLQRARGRREISVVLRASAPGLAIEAALREAVADVAPSTPLLGLRTQREQMALLAGRERLLARLLSVFGAFALGLACVGLYGATAYAVARRTSEIGLRMALGARRDDVWWMVLRSVSVLTLTGVAAGLAASLAAGRLVSAFLYELSPADPFTLVAAALLMGGVSLAAGAVPAARASRIQPLVALRRE